MTPEITIIIADPGDHRHLLHHRMGPRGRRRLVGTRQFGDHGRTVHPGLAGDAQPDCARTPGTHRGEHCSRPWRVTLPPDDGRDRLSLGGFSESGRPLSEPINHGPRWLPILGSRQSRPSAKPGGFAYGSSCHAHPLAFLEVRPIIMYMSSLAVLQTSLWGNGDESHSSQN